MIKQFRTIKRLAIGVVAALLASSAAWAANCAVPGKQDSTCTNILGYSQYTNASAQCAAMGGQYDWNTLQCQMQSLPGSGGGGGWVVGEYITGINNTGWTSGLYIVEQSGSSILVNTYSCRFGYSITTSSPVMCNYRYGFYTGPGPSQMPAQLYSSQDVTHVTAVPVRYAAGSYYTTAGLLSYGDSCDNSYNSCSPSFSVIPWITP